MCESESEVAQSSPTLCDPMDCSYQAPLSMGFSRQQYWSGLPFPSPGDVPNPGIEPGSPSLQTDTLPSEPPGKSLAKMYINKNSYPLLVELKPPTGKMFQCSTVKLNIFISCQLLNPIDSLACIHQDTVWVVFNIFLNPNRNKKPQVVSSADQ